MNAKPKVPLRTRTKYLVALLLLLAAFVLGRYLGHQLPALDLWISGHGMLGWMVFTVLVVLCTSVFIPESVFGVLAGALFGVAGGTILMSAGALIAAAFTFSLSRHFLHQTVRRWLKRQPRLEAVEQAVNKEGLRFQFLLRLTPLSPVAVNYTLGLTNTRFSVFMMASLGMIPTIFLEVYLGHMAKHIAHTAGATGQFSGAHTWFTAIGLVVCVGVMAYITRIAHEAVMSSQISESRVH